MKNYEMECSEHDFTVEYLRGEILKFQELMGLKSFWDDLETAKNAMYGLFYLSGRIKDITEVERNFINACAIEYDRRLAHMKRR